MAAHAVRVEQTSAQALSPGSRWFLVVVAFHVLTRVLTLVMIGLGAQHAGMPLRTAFLRWDGRYYEQVASHGYPSPLPMNQAGEVVTNPAAFFPLFPFLMHVPVALGAPFWTSALAANLVMSTAAAVVIGMVVRCYTTEHVSLVTTCLWSAFPTACVLSVPYTEALFCLLAGATLLAALRERWWLAALLGFLCAFSRPTGVIVVGALGVLGLYLLWTRREWRPLVAGLCSGLGTLAGLATIGASVGRWDAWFVTERQGWRLRFDAGVSLGRWMYDSVLVHPTAFKIAFSAGLLVVVVLAVLALRLRPPLVISVYLVLGLVLAIGQGGKQYLAQLRYVLPLFPLLVPVAFLALRLRPPLLVLGLVALAIASSLVGLYYFSFSEGAP